MLGSSAVMRQLLHGHHAHVCKSSVSSELCTTTLMHMLHCYHAHLLNRWMGRCLITLDRLPLVMQEVTQRNAGTGSHCHAGHSAMQGQAPTVMQDTAQCRDRLPLSCRTQRNAGTGSHCHAGSDAPDGGRHSARATAAQVLRSREGRCRGGGRAARVRGGLHCCHAGGLSMDISASTPRQNFNILLSHRETERLSSSAPVMHRPSYLPA